MSRVKEFLYDNPYPISGSEYAHLYGDIQEDLSEPARPVLKPIVKQPFKPVKQQELDFSGGTVASAYYIEFTHYLENDKQIFTERRYKVTDGNDKEIGYNLTHEDAMTTVHKLAVDGDSIAIHDGVKPHVYESVHAFEESLIFWNIPI